MSQPVPNMTDGQNAQVLMKLGEMGAQLAVINEKLSTLPDHESRLRSLEALAQQTRGGRDTVSRWLGGVSALAAAGAVAAAFLHP